MRNTPSRRFAPCARGVTGESGASIGVVIASATSEDAAPDSAVAVSCVAVPGVGAFAAGQRLVLARTTSVAIGALIDTGTVTRTYEESLTAFEPTDGDALVVTDTATLEALEQAGGSYTILRDYGDVFWDIRMNINDVTNNFANPFTLPEAPQRGAGRK